MGEYKEITYTQNDRQAIIMIEGKEPPSLEFLGELDQLLTSSLKRQPEQSGSIQGGFLPVPPWVEITLLFTATTIATSILNKLGEDLYNKLKSKFSGNKTDIGANQNKYNLDDIGHFKHFHDSDIIKLTLNIGVDGLIVEGYCALENYDMLIDIFRTAHQMIDDAQERGKKEKDMFLQLGDVVPGYSYAYNSAEKKWVYQHFFLHHKPVKSIGKSEGDFEKFFS